MDIEQLKKALAEAQATYNAALPWYKKALAFVAAHPSAPWFIAGFAAAKLVSCVLS